MSTCAMCEHWTLKTSPERAARGEGHCVGFLAATGNFTDWAQPKCGLYRQAKQAAPRKKWIETRNAANAPAESGAKAAPDLSEGAPRCADRLPATK